MSILKFYKGNIKTLAVKTGFVTQADISVLL
jgi:hypothetical protein